MDIDQSSQSNSQRTEFIISPFNETQPKAAREYEETINQLKNENFDLKVTLFLCEEAHKETYHVEGSYNDEKEDCIQIIVNLKSEAEVLKKELRKKEDKLQSVIEECSERVEKHKAMLLEARKEINEQKEFIGILEQLPTINDYNEVSTQYSEMVSESENMKKLLAKKDQEIKKVVLESRILQDKIVLLNRKVKLRDEAIKRCALKFHEETDHIPKHLRPIIKSSIEAAVDNNVTELISTLEDLKMSLTEKVDTAIPSNLQSAYVGDFLAKNSSPVHSIASTENSHVKNDLCARNVSLVQQRDSNQSEIVSSNEPNGYQNKNVQCNLGAQDIESSESDLEISCKSETYVETVLELENENFSLVQKSEESISNIENFTTAFLEIKERERELHDKLGEAYTKINYLEEELENKQNLLDLEIDVPFVSSADKASQYDLVNQTESLIQEINSGIIQNLTASISDLEKKERELQDQLSKAMSKIKSLEQELDVKDYKLNTDAK
ncbi:putative leucine-rich repeat-containing protein DDB_G0290503 [Parasteatoda tepidariorum]|uniref:putative leucine-rich repeat-containing protein DDB_G0290503 n=1 Tax=Parasteatoda tepidariorum TaxID=114398 RepID=UPI0039BC4A2D